MSDESLSSLYSGGECGVGQYGDAASRDAEQIAILWDIVAFAWQVGLVGYVLV
ncbi:hypothetical protein M430DRAFT_37375 [Amorphotheca resinae ATCC 22711]|jgi:hypothetical protein|uniref:Uncharacterized protein n=1 Tax=Amorphotheca resinae ATCC 22711 TaxID=857342 RepID=A0A2T3AQJ3_AMORE|nr:hypothetical protein M430DRAFT_37375 [Amorphotheca resinae ATCC 22711]PSS08541.1 hypothetical protein M430DRAFT_37375 [Amorphotheca resinae ATCC 22711]